MAGTYKLKSSSPPREQPRPPVEHSVPVWQGGRLVSLDAFRGFIMFVLAAEGFGLSRFARISEDSAVWKIADYDSWQTIGFHFRHAEWVTASTSMGIAFWDLIQPAFMFMVGVAMPFSYARRTNFGESSGRRLFHALRRALVLVLLGVFLYSLGQPRTNWIFPNVLAQIGLGYFFVYLLHHRPPIIQIAAIVAILGGYWALFYMNPPPEDFDYSNVNASVEKGEVFQGRMAPWSKNSNVAFRFDQWLLPKLRSPQPEQSDTDSETADESEDRDNNGAVGESSSGMLRQWFFSNPQEYRYNRGGYTTLNFVPSMATALFGVLCGQLLTSGRRPSSIVLSLVVAGGICIALGLVGHTTVCPIVKRIWTPTWTLFSGGCVIWMLAAFYVLFDVLPFGKLSWPLQVVGMNSLVMYFMGELLHHWVADKVVGIHLTGFLESVIPAEYLRPDMFGTIIQHSAVALVFWLTCVWMYRNKLFIRV